jgi:peptidoglycan/xylan/chitin deacetylase (PgdA/CDA1 family)
MLKTFLKKIVKFILVKLNLIRLFLLFAPPGRLVILNYHRISDKKSEKSLSPFDLGVTRGKFEKEMGYLNRNFSVLSFSRAIDLLKHGKDWPKFPVVISFDDGYRDFYLNAFPILEKYNLTAIVFISTKSLEDGGSFWWDEIRKLVENNSLEVMKLALENSSTPVYALDLKHLKTIRDKKAFLEKMTCEFKKLKGRHRDELLNKLKLLLKIGKDAEREILSWEEIRELRKAGIEFGSHTHSHYLLNLEDEKTVEEEIRLSKKKLEENLKEKIEFLSYPSGLYNARVKELVVKAGYKAACSSHYGYNTRDGDFFALKRLGLEESQSLDDFIISLGRLFGALPLLEE